MGNSASDEMKTPKESLAEEKAETGDDLYESKSYEAALAIYTEVIGLCPESPAYYDKRAACYMMLGKYREALADAKKCISLDPNCVKAYTTEMKCSLIVGDVGAARTALRKVLVLDPNNSRILTDQEHLEYLEKYLKELKMAEARNEFRKVLYCLERCCEVSTSCPAFEQRKAYCLEVLAKQKQEALKRADLARVKAETGDEFYNSKSYEAALAIYTEVIGLCPESPAYYDKRAACYMMLGKYREALADAKKCISLDPNCVKAYTTEMKCSLIVGDVGAARTALRKVLVLDPNNSRILTDQEHLEYLEKYLKELKMAEARNEFRKVLYCLERCCEVSTSCPAFEQRKAYCLEVLAKQKQEALKRADLARVKAETGDEFYNSKSYEAALAIYTEVIGLCPESPAYYDKRAACYMMLSKYKEALADAKKCISLDPKCVKAYTTEMKCSLIVGDVGAARTALRKVLVLDPNNSRILTDQEHLEYLEKYLKELKMAEARNEFRKVLYCLERCCEVSTSCPAFEQRKAYCLEVLAKQKQEALKRADLARVKAETGDEFYNSKSYEAALAIYTEVIGLCPESPAYYDKRAACYMMLSKYKEALTDAKKCISLDPKCVKAYTTEMKCSLIVGDVGAARTALRKVLVLDPNNSRILTDQEHLEYLEKYLKELKMAEARNEFRKVLYCLERCCEVSTSCPAFEQRKAYCLEVLAKQKQEALKRADLARVKAETGDEFYNSKSYEAALAIYTEVIGLCPESPAYYDKRAACYMMLSKYKEALADAKKCISLDPKCVKAYTTEMKCSLIVGDVGAARTALRKVLVLDPNNSRILTDQEHLEYLEKYLKELKMAEARNEFRKVLYCLERCCEVSTSCPAFEQRKAYCLEVLAKQKQEALKRADLARVKAETGDEFYNSKSYEAALAIYTEVIGLCPESPAYYDKRAACYMMLSKYKEALTDAKKCISLDPKCVKAYTTEMKCSLIVGDVGAARTALRKVLVLDPNNSRILTDQEHLEYLEKYLKELKMAEARNEFRKVLYCLERCCEVSTSCPAFEQRKAYCLEVLAKQKQEALKRADLARVKAETGDEFYNSKSYEAALAIYTEVIGLCPESPAYYDKRAACYMMLSKYKEALADAKKCISLDPKCVKAYTTEMKCSLIVGDVGAARTALRKVLVLDPNNSRILTDQEHLEYLEKYLKELKMAEARNEFRKVLYCLERCCEVSTSCPAFEQRKAYCLEVLAKQKQEALKRADLARVKAETGDEFYNSKSYEAALAIYTEVIGLCPESPAYYDKRAACYMMLSKYKEALTDAKKCISLDPKCVKAYTTEMKCSLIVGDVGAARTALRKVLVLDPNNSRILTDQEHLEYLEKYLKELKMAEARNEFRKVLYCLERCCEVSTSCPAFEQRKAYCLEVLAKQKQEALKRADLARVKAETGDEFYNSKSYEAALAIYTEVIGLCPESPAYYDKRAACYMMLSKYKEALTDAKKCISLDPKCVKAYTTEMKCSLIVGDVGAARTALRKVLVLDPNNSRILTDQEHLEYLEKFWKESQVALARKEYDKVVSCLDRCCEVSTSCPDLRLWKAESLIFLGKFQEAQEIANDILHHDKENADAIYIRALNSYYQDRDPLPDFQQVLRLAPDHTKALHMYKKAKTAREIDMKAIDAYRNGKFDESLEFNTKALSVDPQNKICNARFHQYKSETYFALGKIEEALRECTLALKLSEGYLPSLRQRALCHSKLGDFEEAMYDYEHACEFNGSQDNKNLQETKSNFEKSVKKDYYQILGINKNAKIDDIKQAYRTKHSVHHPDKHSDAADIEIKKQKRKFRQVDDAYATLSDVYKRTRYDQELNKNNAFGGGSTSRNH